MLSGRNIVHATVMIVSAALILGGCSAMTESKPNPKPSVKSTAIPAAKKVPKPGQCFAKEVPDLDDFAPDLGSRVDCTKPHIYEVTGVVDVPKRFLKAKTPKELVALRKDFAKLTNDGELQKKFDEFAWEECWAADAKATGLSKLEFNGKSPSEVHLQLFLRDAPGWLNIMDAGNWAAGNTKFLCMIRYSKHRDDGDFVDPEAIRSKSTTPSIQAFLTKDFPLERRQCLARVVNGGLEPESCEEQHFGEMFFVFDAEAAFGAKFVESIGPKAPTEKQLTKLNKPCIDSLSTILGEGYDNDLTAVADPGPNGWIAKGEYFPAYCIVVARDGSMDLPGGTLVGNAKDVDLAPEKGQAA